jgi:hypothetical protein
VAKYVLIEFDDDSEADAFANVMIGQAEGSSMRVRGVFKKPTIFCECANSPEKNVRGNKWGWWLCKLCSKPKKNMLQSPTNLIDPDDRKKQLGRKIFFTIREGE